MELTHPLKYGVLEASALKVFLSRSKFVYYRKARTLNDENKAEVDIKEVGVTGCSCAAAVVGTTFARPGAAGEFGWRVTILSNKVVLEFISPAF